MSSSEQASAPGRAPSRHRTAAAALLAMAAVAGLASAHAAGAVDPAFGGGRVVTDFAGGTDAAAAVVVQRDGRVLVVGDAAIAATGGSVYAFGIARYTANGALDPTFGNGGRVLLPAATPGDNLRALGAAVAADGRIVVVGHTGFAGGHIVVVRLTAAGTLDPGFGVGGIVTLQVRQAGIPFDALARGALSLPDGRIAVFGEVDIPTDAPAARGLVAMLLADGTPDARFGGNGGPGIRILGLTDPQRPFFVPVSGIYDAVLQGDRLVLAGGAGVDGQAGVTELLLTRIDTTSGATDVSFGREGATRLPAAPTETFTSLVALADGRLVAAGTKTSAAFSAAALRLKRFSADGVPDDGFAEPTLGVRASPRLARRTTPSGDSVWMSTSTAPSPGGDFVLAAWSGTGAPDGAFGTAGLLAIHLGGDDVAAAVGVTADGLPVLAGRTRTGASSTDNFAVVRVDPSRVVTVPAAPTQFSASAASGTAVQLRWTDAASDEAGYAIDRATRADFVGAVRVATTVANATGFRDTGLSPNTTYWYRIAAFNGAGASAAATTSVRTPRR